MKQQLEVAFKPQFKILMFFPFYGEKRLKCHKVKETSLKTVRLSADGGARAHFPNSDWWSKKRLVRWSDIFLTQVRESKRVFDSGFHSLVGFRIPWAVFRNPKPRIPDSTSENFPHSGIRIPCTWRTFEVWFVVQTLENHRQVSNGTLLN